MYSKRGWSADLPRDVVVPGLELTSTDAGGANGTLPASNIAMGAPTDLIVNNIELGMLTTPNLEGAHASSTSRLNRPLTTSRPSRCPRDHG
ncbi:M66 family metalloprotease [Arthrobacter sp. Sr24]